MRQCLKFEKRRGGETTLTFFTTICLTNNSSLVLLAAQRSTALSDERMAKEIEHLLVTEAELGQEGLSSGTPRRETGPCEGASVCHQPGGRRLGIAH
jgi:hypothetical protein